VKGNILCCHPPEDKIQVRNIPSSTVYRIHPIDRNELLIQYIKDDLFTDIAQFHFFSTIIVEESIIEKNSNLDKVIKDLQSIRAKHSF